MLIKLRCLAIIAILWSITSFLVMQVVPPTIGGIYYYGCGDRYAEQFWLNRVIHELLVERAHSTDPELNDLIDYTIRRYNHVGAWDVMIMPLFGSFGDREVIGCNCPFCPGLTLDPHVMDYDLKTAANVLLHEACHDYFPYIHTCIDPKMKRLKIL